MENQHLIDTAYEIVKEKYLDKPFSFQDLWKALVRKGRLSPEEQENNIGSLYTEILQDPRFIFIGNKMWKLKEFMSREQTFAFENSLYDFNTDLLEDGVVLPESDKNDEENEELEPEISDSEDEYLDFKNKYKNPANIDEEAEEIMSSKFDEI